MYKKECTITFPHASYLFRSLQCITDTQSLQSLALYYRTKTTEGGESQYEIRVDMRLDEDGVKAGRDGRQQVRAI